MKYLNCVHTDMLYLLPELANTRKSRSFLYFYVKAFLEKLKIRKFSICEIIIFMIICFRGDPKIVYIDGVQPPSPTQQPERAQAPPGGGEHTDSKKR